MASDFRQSPHRSNQNPHTHSPADIEQINHPEREQRGEQRIMDCNESEYLDSSYHI